jgi:16S rRNA (adenine1518-N6/adenine1519-N6)-dimethyltransferase
LRIELWKPTVIRAVLAEHGLRPNKALGQNFIADRKHLERIVGVAGVGAGDGVLEIGPGIGALTRELSRRCGFVVAVEIDRGLVRALGETCGDLGNVKIIHADILGLDLGEVLSEIQAGRARAGITEPGDVRVVANLPYYITTPTIFRLLEYRESIRSMVFLVQREVAARLTAAPASSDYGALTVAAGSAGEITLHGRVPPAAFYPRPEITSAIVRIDTRIPGEQERLLEPLFSELVRLSFAQRRKTLRNALESFCGKDHLEEAFKMAGLDPSLRGEALSIRDFWALAAAFGNLQNRRVDARL